MEQNNRLKIKSISFGESKFRKLRNITIPIAERITLIAGHNAVGKSTILGLIASASANTEKRSYFGRSFSYDINEIIHLDPIELEEKQLKLPWPKIVYSSNEIEHWKTIRITQRTKETRLRSVSTTDINSPDKELAKTDGKFPLPTIYLGMLRMLPIGESDPNDIECTNNNEMDPEDRERFKEFIEKVINNSTSNSSNIITKQTIKHTRKNSNHPSYSYSVRSISLGQDSLSSIATAIASFYKIKRELGKLYRGGILLIDEIDAGFHPKAQQNLIDALSNAANHLSLQIIATTHSTRLIEYVHPDSPIRNNTHRKVDKVIYLAGTTTPSAQVDWSLEKILSDMSLSPLPLSNKKKAIPTVKAYLEDNQALTFLKGILGMKLNKKTYNCNNNKIRLEIIPIGVGGSNLINLPKHDKYFDKVLLIVDADTKIPRTSNNALKLPTQLKKSYNPERTIYEYIRELAKGTDSLYNETYGILIKEGITEDRLNEEFIKSATDIKKRESSKKWFENICQKMIQYNIFKYWAQDHSEEIETFNKELKKKLEFLIENKLSDKN